MTTEIKAADELYRAGDGWIETQSGKFSLDNPTFNIFDIAHALSQTVRFNGHCRYFYSVAEHSVLVSHLIQSLGLGDPLEGLLHDGTEAYLSDVPAPFKQFLPDWKEIDAKLDKALRSHFGIGDKTPGCKQADWLALFLEAYELIPSRGECFVDPQDLRPRALLLRKEFPIRCLDPVNASCLFLARYRELTGAIR